MSNVAKAAQRIVDLWPLLWPVATFCVLMIALAVFLVWGIR